MEKNQINYYHVDESKRLDLLFKDGFILNPNEKVVDAIVKRIFDNDGNCPCHNDSYDKKCPCSDYREKNICHCNLYIKEK